MLNKIKIIFSSFTLLALHFIVVSAFLSEVIPEIYYFESFVFSLLNILIGGVALYISYFAYFAYKRSRVVQMFVIAASFFVFGASFLIYVLSGPDFNFLGILKTVFSLAKDYGIFTGALMLLFFIVPIDRYEKKIYKYKLSTFLGIITIYSFALLVSVIRPEYALGLQELSGAFLGSTAILLFIVIIFLLHQYREVKSKFLLNLLVGVSFVVSSIITSFFDEYGNLFWWYGQLSILIGFIIIILGFVRAQWQEKGYKVVVGDIPISSRIGTKLLGSFLLVAALSVFLTGYFSFTTAKNSLSGQVQDNLDLTVKSKESDVVDFLNLKKKEVNELVQDKNLQSIINNIKNNNQLIDELNEYIGLAGTDFYQIDIINSLGMVTLSTREKSVGDNRGNWSYYNIAKNLEPGESYLSDVFAGLNNRPTIIATVKVLNNNNDFDTFIGYIDADILNSVLVGVYSDQIMSVDGYDARGRFETYLVSRDNYIISNTKFSRDLVLKEKNITKPVVSCKYGDRFVGEYEDYRRVSVVGASVCLSNGWTLLTEISVDEVYSSLEIIKIKILLASLAIVVLVFIMVYILVRRITDPIKELSNIARKISEGNYDVQATISETSEIGALANSFNTMTANIVKKNISLKDQYSQLEKTSSALRDSKEHLEEKVKARTEELELAKAYLEEKVKERTKELQVLNVGLEDVVTKRTSELKEKLVELERFNKLAVGRELKMIELKAELKEVKKKSRIKRKKKK